MANVRCPLCGGKNVAKILRGFNRMNPKLQEEIESKKVILGGCVVSGKDPLYHCNDCNKEIIYPTKQEEAQTVYFEFTIGGFCDGHQRIEVEKNSDAISAKYYPLIEEEEQVECIELTQEEFVKYIHEIYSTALLEWNEEYDDLDIEDGEQWGITIRYINGEEREWYGSNDYPPLWKEFIKAVNMLPLPDIK